MSLTKNQSNCPQQSDLITSESENSKYTFEETKPAPRNQRIDESQLSQDEVIKLHKRRAYNRLCASRARKRTKTMVAQLQTEVDTLHTEKAELRAANEILRQQVEYFQQQCRALLIQQANEKKQLARVLAASSATMQEPALMPETTFPPYDGILSKLHKWR